ncbi:MAG: hypothetical protein KDB00_12155 [Planctomycetales bacterium]|nr:hypothetical protein [Planctomycetales bacterium]
MNSARVSTEKRISESLGRLGFAQVSAHQMDPGEFKLVGIVKSREERLIAFAAALTTPGVCRIANEIEIS